MKDWIWRPDLGTWQLDRHGYPADPAFLSLGTNLAEDENPYDFWRRVAFADFEADPLRKDEARQFRASAFGFSWQKADFFVSESDPVSGGRTRRRLETDGLDSITFGLVVEGRRDAVQEGDERISTGPGGMFVYDGAKPSTVAWNRHKVVYVVARREAVRTALGGEPLPVSVLARRLERSPIGKVLRDHMMSMARNMKLASKTEQAFLLSQASDMAIHAIAGQEAADAQSDQNSALLAAATAYIEQHLSEPSLSSSRVARALGCSRSTLYRLFSTHETGVAGYIRDLRLDRARTLIENAPVHIPVADLALQCGIYDTANFSRQFRRRFGVPPSELRGLNKND